MRFWRKKGDHVLVVGIFQSVGVGRTVLQNLRRARFRRAAAIYASAKGRQRIEEHGISAIGGSAAALILSVVLGVFIFWERGMLGDNRLAGVALPLAAFAFGGAITGWILVQLLREHIDSASFARFTNTILPNDRPVMNCLRVNVSWKRRLALHAQSRLAAQRSRGGHLSCSGYSKSRMRWNGRTRVSPCRLRRTTPS